ncbi:MAG: hypothetical protein WC533_03400 [Candidatus Pacearchaeota archaeon]
MDIKDYLLRQVKPEEFVELKKQEANLFFSVMDGFNDVWKPRVRGIITTFKYNPKRNAVGIYVERNGQPQLVVERQGLSEPEEAVVGSLYLALEQRLDRLRLPKEEWVESVTK